jgi:hypothetical protein
VYNPHFVYHFPKSTKIYAYIEQLEQLQQNIVNAAFDSPLRSVYEEKIQESLAKAQLLLAYSIQSYDDILQYGTALYGSIDESLVSESQEIIANKKRIPRSAYGKVLAVDEVKKRI